MEQTFSIARKGYEPAEVDRFISKLELELSNYKRNEASIAKSIIHAENTAQQIINDAHLEATKVRSEASQQLVELQKKIKHMRMKLDAFQSSYNQLMHKYIITMNSNDFNDLYSSLDKINDSLTLDNSPNEYKEDEANNIIEMTYEKVKADY